jgi:hypothetical protein
VNYNIKMLESGADYELFDTILSVVFVAPPDTDERLYQYQDVLEGRKEKSEIVEALRSCLARYARLRYELVRVRAVAHVPRTFQRVWNVLTSVPLAEACGFTCTGLLFEGILRGEIMPDVVAVKHAQLHEKPAAAKTTDARQGPKQRAHSEFPQPYSSVAAAKSPKDD